MKAISIRASVECAAEVGKTVVLESCRQVREQHGALAAMEVCGGALSAAVALVLLTLGEQSARKILDSALEAGLESIAEQAREAMH